MISWFGMGDIPADTTMANDVDGRIPLHERSPPLMPCRAPLPRALTCDAR